MANDFAMAEARSGNSLEQTSADTRHYLSAVQTVLQERAARGQIILVAEAVVASTAPDITPEVREAVGKLITANPAPRLPAAASGQVLDAATRQSPQTVQRNPDGGASMTDTAPLPTPALPGESDGTRPE
jgi:hypothetical protein